MVKLTAGLFARRDDFPAGGSAGGDVHIAPADPSASSAPSAPSGFDFCLSQRLSVSAVNILWRVSLCLYGGLILPATHAAAQDAREIVRRAIELDRNNWIQRADYTWAGHSRERHFDARDQVTSDRQETWETLILDGLPFTRILTRDGKPLPAAEQQKQQQKLDKETAKLASETPAEKQKRAAGFEKSRRHERAFLLEIPDAFGLFLARLSPGAKLVLEQTRINGELWLPKREYMVGNGRIALLKRIAEDDEITWTDYRKFQVDSRIVPRDP